MLGKPFPERIIRRHGSGVVDAGISVARDNDEAVQAVNKVIKSADDLARGSNPDVLPAPGVTGMISVYERDKPAFHCVLLHRLDYRPLSALGVGRVVVFSDPVYAPCRTERLQLATPGYYRDGEHLGPGIRDRHDGTLFKDGTKWASSVMGGTVKAHLRFVTSAEPWVYCASHYRNDREFRRLRREFSDRHGYSAANCIRDPDAFAAWLGIDFALGFDKTAHVSLSLREELAYASIGYPEYSGGDSRTIDTVVHVYYGPVNYEDVSGRLDTQANWFDPNAGPVAWFTKRTSFANQNEYRFAVATPGTPVQPLHYVAVSPELRALTCAV